MNPMNLEYRVRVHQEEGSYWAEVVELPGCFVSGDSLDEIWEALPEAVAIYLSNADSRVEVRLTEKEFVSSSEEVDARLVVCN